MPLDPALHRLRNVLTPSTAARSRARAQVRERIARPAFWADLHTQLTPTEASRARVWRRVSAAMSSPAVGLLDQLRDTLAPMAVGHLTPVFAPVRHREMHWMRWVAVACVLVLVVQVVPLALHVSPTVAASSIIVRPTGGQAYVAHIATLEPLSAEQSMEMPMRLKTAADGSVTVAAYDDYVARLDHDTDAEWHDLSDRPEPAIGGPTLTLWSGRLWLQGLVPSHVRGITVATSAGEITVHEGSVDIAAGATVKVRVFDRNATIVHDGRTITLVAGEWTQLWPYGLPIVKPIADREVADAWGSDNISQDAWHRREVAQWQQERRAAQAGILPTSTFYPAKRALEAVSNLTTFDPAARVQRKLAQAETRLNEAAALLQQGEDDEAAASMAEYRTTLVALATEEGADNAVTQFVLRQALAEDTAGLAAVAPGEDAYVLKQTAFEAGAALPQETLGGEQVTRVLLLDQLRALHAAVLAGDLAAAQDMYLVLQPSLAMLTGDDVAPVVSKEAHAILRALAVALQTPPEGIVVDAGLRDALASYLPASLEPLPLSAQEVAGIVGGILDRTTGIYETERGLTNSFSRELQLIRGHSDEVRILQQLLPNLLPRYDFLAYYVDIRLRELRRDRLQ
ncbi:MAG: Uncharacterized protein G01um101425_759 [Candidatus Peregrinibacteria bacterium Gr01-1014_25]|nr:MAG: Uncharacterized protein G01um101425_759 [Candidatus Peregrinibacteria bacterium Gr01-1014_25]